MAKKIPTIVKQIQKHKLLEIDYRTQKNISFSQLQMYSQCPWKWDLVYRQGHKIYQPSIHTVFGKAFHETVQNWLTVMYEQTGVEADKIDLEEYLLEKIKHHYQDEYQGTGKTHFSTKEELNEFYQDGVAILREIKKNRAAYFGRKGWYLVGVELPVLIEPNPEYKNIIYKGYLDLVLYHEPSEEFYILDFKTSTRGWDDKTKKDEMKQAQLILYKEYYHKQFGVDRDKINVKFLIVKRKIWEQSEYVQRRVQEYIPPSGPIKTKKVLAIMDEFIKNCYNMDGSLKDTAHCKKPSDSNCRFCPFKDRGDLCDRGQK